MHPAPSDNKTIESPVDHRVVDNVVDKTYVAPTIQTVASPVDTPAAPVAVKRPNIINLYGDEQDSKAPAHTEEPADEGIHLVTRNPQQPVRTEEPAPVQQHPAAQTTAKPRMPQGNKLDMMAMDRAERIKAINDLLRNDINGAQIVESMKISELTGQEIEVELHSDKSEAAASVIAPDGTVRPNASLYQLPD